MSNSNEQLRAIIDKLAVIYDCEIKPLSNDSPGDKLTIQPVVKNTGPSENFVKEFARKICDELEKRQIHDVVVKVTSNPGPDLDINSVVKNVIHKIVINTKV